MDAALAALPDDVETLKAALLAARADIAVALAEQSSNRALIAHLKLQIEKLNRARFGPRSERTARLLDQMELQLEELETAATEDELAAETAAAKTTTVASFTRARPARRPFPERLPRERVVVPGPVACACCGSARLSKLGEDVTESLETIPRTWKVIQHVREKFSCRDCEHISQAPMAAKASSTSPHASQARSWKPHAGLMHAGSSSCWPTSRAARAGRHRARRLRCCRRSAWRPCSASMPCSTSSERSTAAMPMSAELPGRPYRHHWSPTCIGGSASNEASWHAATT